MKRFVTTILLGLAFTNQATHAKPLIDGRYSGPEEYFIIREGRLYECHVAGITNGPCQGRQIKFTDQKFAFYATQAGENAIRINGYWNLLCKGKKPYGTDAFSARCTPEGWK